MSGNTWPIKVVIISYSHYSTPAQVDRVARMMAALRKAAGLEVEIRIDFLGRPFGWRRARLHRRVEPQRPMFVEEVLSPGDFLELREVTSKMRVPIATGERLVDLAEFGELFWSGQHRAAGHLPLRHLQDFPSL